jgi:hypothetical protein
MIGTLIGSFRMTSREFCVMTSQEFNDVFSSICLTKQNSGFLQNHFPLIRTGIDNKVENFKVDRRLGVRY